MIGIKRNQGKTIVNMGSSRIIYHHINRHRFNEIKKQIETLQKLFLKAMYQGKRKN